MPEDDRKLSDLIREGAKLRPQGFGWMFKDGCTCALAAAFEAKTGHPPTRGEDVHNTLAITPATYRSVTRWNDHDRYTREHIADLLREKGL